MRQSIIALTLVLAAVATPVAAVTPPRAAVKVAGYRTTPPAIRDYIATRLEIIAGFDPDMTARYWRDYNLEPAHPSVATMALYVAHVLGPDQVSRAMYAEWQSNETPAARVRHIYQYVLGVTGSQDLTGKRYPYDRGELEAVRDFATSLLGNESHRRGAFVLASTSFNSTVADELRSWASTEVLSREDLLDRVAACSEHLGTESWDDYDAAFAATAVCVWTGRSNAFEILKRAGNPPTASGIVGGLEDFHVWYYRNGDGGGFDTRAWADKRVRQLQEYLGGK